jgi:tetratricopeptide (TPR) repeat protein
MPERTDPNKLRKERFHSSLSRVIELHCSSGWFRRTIGPVTGGVRRTAKRTVLLLLISTFALTSSRGQSPASRTSQVHVHLERAQAALKANAPETAVKEFREVLALDPKNAEAYANLGVIAFFQRDYQNASQYLRNALAIDPSLVKTQALLGICERRLGKGSAQALLEKSFPRLKDKKLQIQVGMELAGIYEQQGNLDRTAAVMRSLVDLDPDNVEILYMAQRVYTDLADDTLNKLAILAPGSARMQEVIAEHLVNGGDLKGAIEHYQKALEIDPHLPGVHFELGEALWQSTPKDAHAQAEAEKEFETAIKMDGDSAGVECQLGEIAFLRADRESAQAHYERAYALNQGDAEAQLGLGKVLMSTGKPQEAIKYLRMAVQSDPLDTQAHYRLGMAYKALKMADESRHELQLFQEITEAKGRVRQLYRQMNKQSRNLDEQLSGIDQ